MSNIEGSGHVLTVMDLAESILPNPDCGFYPCRELRALILSLVNQVYFYLFALSFVVFNSTHISFV